MTRRAWAGEIVLMLGACLSAGYQLASLMLVPEPPRRHAALVAGYDQQRYQGLADALPPGGVVGYVTEDPDDLRTYYLSQYVLAPCLLVPGIEPALVLADDQPDGEVRAELADRTLLRDLGNGVRLYGREEPR